MKPNKIVEIVTKSNYSLENEGYLQIAPGFKVREFACHDGSDLIIIHPLLVNALDAIWQYFGSPVKIVSGYRSPFWNKKCGGVKGSYHMLGMAADISLSPRYTPAEVWRKIDAGEVPGIDPERIGLGRYLTFTHIDVRGSKARWDG